MDEKVAVENENSRTSDESKNVNGAGTRGAERRVYDFFTRTTRRKILSCFFGLSVIGGTFRGIEGGLPPIYTVKTGASYGTNIGIVTRYKEGAKQRGADISLFRGMAGGETNGVALAFLSGTKPNRNINRTTSTINGLEFSLGCLGGERLREENGVLVGGSSHIVNGEQIGIGNASNGGYVAQIGLFSLYGPADAVSFRDVSFSVGVGVNGWF